MDPKKVMKWTSLLIIPFVIASGEDSYTSKCEVVKGRILDGCIKQISELSATLDSSTPIQGLGAKCDEILNAALDDFSSSAPPSTSDPTLSSLYDKSLLSLESSISSPLHVLYLRQLSLLRERAITKYKQSSKSESSEYEAMVEADDYFTTAAEDSTRSNGEPWDYESERRNLQGVLNEMASQSKKVAQVKINASQQQSTAMQYLQMQQQQIQQMQMQLYGQSSPWNVGFAYRVPDTNINLQGSHQQGRTSFQMSCVPDEYANMLGPNGFTNGVGPGNLGVSVNVNL